MGAVVGSGPTTRGVPPPREGLVDEGSPSVKHRCPHCDARVSASMRRCLRCGAQLERASAGDEVVVIARPPVMCAAGDRVGGRYTVIEAHGAGPLGTAYRARDLEGRMVAVKFVPRALYPDGAERDTLRDALRAMVGRSIDRVSLPVDVGVDDEGVLYVVTRWAHGVSLRTLLRAYRAAERTLSPDQLFGVLQGASAALRELQRASSHGALYPENVVVTADAVVLIDPGLGASVSARRFAQHLQHFPDVYPYLAPEVRAGKRANAGADLYSLGVLASELLYGDPQAALSPHFTAGEFGVDVADLIRQLLSQQVAQRAAALPQLLDRLGHLAGEASLPPYAPLPPPSPMVDARTRRVQAIARPGANLVPVPRAVDARPSTPRSAHRKQGDH